MTLAYFLAFLRAGALASFLVFFASAVFVAAFAGAAFVADAFVADAFDGVAFVTVAFDGVAFAEAFALLFAGLAGASTTGVAAALAAAARGWGPPATPPTAVLNPVPGRKAGTVAAGTATVWPVRGLRPTRAARALASKTPKPVRDTDSPDLTVSTMVDSNSSTADAAVRRSPSRAASASMSWDLFMVWRP